MRNLHEDCSFKNYHGHSCLFPLYSILQYCISSFKKTNLTASSLSQKLISLWVVRRSWGLVQNEIYEDVLHSIYYNGYHRASCVFPWNHRCSHSYCWGRGIWMALGEAQGHAPQRPSLRRGGLPSSAIELCHEPCPLSMSTGTVCTGHWHLVLKMLMSQQLK